MDKKTLSKNKKLKNVVVEPVEIHNVEPDVVHEIKPVNKIKKVVKKNIDNDKIHDVETDVEHIIKPVLEQSDVEHIVKPVLEQSDVEPVEIQAFEKKSSLYSKILLQKGKGCLPRRFFSFES